MIHLQAAFVRGRDDGSGAVDIVLLHIRARAGRQARAVGLDAPRERDYLPRKLAEAILRDAIVGEGVAHKTPSVWPRAGGGGIVNHQPLVLGVHPVAKIALEHFRRWHGKDQIVGAHAVAEPFVGGEEEGPVPAVVKFGNPHRPAAGRAEIVLLVNSPHQRKEASRIQRVVAEEVIHVPVKLVGAGSGDERHHAAARLPVLGFEPVGVDGEFGDGLHGRSGVGDFDGVGRAVGRDRQSVERRVPGGGLSAPQRERAALPLRFGHDGHQVEHAAHRAADHQRQLVEHFVLHRGGDARILGLHLHRRGLHLDGLGHLADLQPDIHAHRGRRGQHHIVLDEAFEPGVGDLDPVAARRKIRGVVFAGAGGENGNRGIGGQVGDLHRRAAHRSAGGVLDNPHDISPLRLAGGNERKQHPYYNQTLRHGSHPLLSG